MGFTYTLQKPVQYSKSKHGSYYEITFINGSLAGQAGDIIDLAGVDNIAFIGLCTSGSKVILQYIICDLEADGATFSVVLPYQEHAVVANADGETFSFMDSFKQLGLPVIREFPDPANTTLTVKNILPAVLNADAADSSPVMYELSLYVRMTY